MLARPIPHASARIEPPAAVMHRAAVVAALVLVLAACCLDVAGSHRLHEKTRYDRSISDNILGSSGIRVVNKKPRIFTDEATLYSAYKDAGQSVCYLEKLKRSELDDADLWLDVIRSNKKMLHSSDRLLTKLEAWRLAGGRIVEFCKGMKMLLLDGKSGPRSVAAAAAAALPDPLDNVLPGEENDGVARRRVAAAAAVAPPRIRGKGDAPPSTPAEMEAEKREGTGPLEGHQERRKREAGPRGARFRGQTQSQYLSLGGDGKPAGKAEAEASQQSSRALVSGSSGMGQAQSMSSGNEGCDGCLGYERIGSFPVGIQGTLGSQQNLPTGVKGNLDNTLF